MTDRLEEVRIAVGLSRRAAALLVGAGLGISAAAIEDVVEKVLAQNPSLRANEMSPELACLAAGIPLAGAPQPVDEIAPRQTLLGPLAIHSVGGADAQ